MLAITFKTLLHSRVHFTSEPLVENGVMTISELDDLNNEIKIQSLLQNQNVNKIILSGDNIASIPTYNCFKLVETFTIDSDIIEEIPKKLFLNSSTIKTVELSMSVTTIGEKAFFMSSIHTINLEGVQYIQQFAFYSCPNLESITFGDCEEIGQYAFAYCSSLTSVTVNIFINPAGRGAFYGTGFTTNPPLIDPNELVGAPLETIIITHESYLILNFIFPKLKLIIIENSPEKIRVNNQPNLEEIRFIGSGILQSKEYNFENNLKLSKIDTSRFSIFASYVFHYCKSLKSVDLSSAETIYGAFIGCSNLEKLTGLESSNKINIYQGAFYKCYKLKIPIIDANKFNFKWFPIPSHLNCFCFSGIEDVKFASFDKMPCLIGCPNLKKVEFLDSCTFTKIKSNAFLNCPSLQEIIISPTITEIEKNSFVNLNLTKFDLKNVITIQSCAFNRSGIRELVINKDITIPRLNDFSNPPPIVNDEWIDAEPDEIQFILYDEPNFERITLKQGVTKTYLQNIKSFHSFTFDVTENDMFSIDNNDNVIYSNNKHAIEAVLSSSSTSYVVPDSVYIIRPYAFSPAANLEEITVNSNIISFDMVFANCFSLKTVTITSPITYFHSKMFANCPNLTTINIQSTITKIDDSCFIGCQKLDLSAFPNSLEYIGSFAFMNCKSITKINLEKVKYIPQYCFSGCNSIIIENANALIEIGRFAFANSGITQFTCPSTLVEIYESAFKDCIKLNTFVIGLGLKRILANVFMNTSLTSLEIPNNIILIHPHAFDYTLKIKFTFPNGEHPIFAFNENCFYNKLTKQLIFTYGFIENRPLILPHDIESYSIDSVIVNKYPEPTPYQSFLQIIVHEKAHNSYIYPINWNFYTCYLGIGEYSLFSTRRDMFRGSNVPKPCPMKNNTSPYIADNYPAAYLYGNEIYNESRIFDNFLGDWFREGFPEDVQVRSVVYLDLGESYNMLISILLIIATLMFIVIISLLILLCKH